MDKNSSKGTHNIWILQCVMIEAHTLFPAFSASFCIMRYRCVLPLIAISPSSSSCPPRLGGEGGSTASDAVPSCFCCLASRAAAAAAAACIAFVGGGFVASQGNMSGVVMAWEAVMNHEMSSRVKVSEDTLADQQREREEERERDDVKR